MAEINLATILHLMNSNSMIRRDFPFTRVELLQLSTVCKGTFKVISSVICAHYWFCWPLGCKFKWNAPCGIRIPYGSPALYSFTELPSSIILLEILSPYTHNLLDTIPPTVTHLTLAYDFNQSIDHLPPTILFLTIESEKYDCHIDNLPPNLLSLTIKSTIFNKPLDHLPDTLNELLLPSLEWPYDIESFDHLPPSLETFECSAFMQSLDHLPPTLKLLAMRFDEDYLFGVDYLPNSITSLVFSLNCFMPLDTLPNSVTSLRILGDFNQAIDYLPPNLKILDLEATTFDQPLDYLPPSLTSLSLGNNFQFFLDHLPQGLTKLEIKSRYSNPLDYLPSSLTMLSLGGYVGPLRYFPSALRHFLLCGVDVLKFCSQPPRKETIIQIPIQ